MILSCNTDRFLLEVVHDNEYDYLFRDLVVIDVGCNIGTFSVLLQPLAKQIHAIDISADNIQNFDRTISNNLIRNIKTYCCGISGNTGKKGIVKSGDAGQGGWRLDTYGDEVDTYTLADFMKRYGIEYVDVLKIDAEGAEGAIVSSPDFPHEKVSCILGEVHTLQSDGMVDVKSWLEKWGYRYYSYPNNHFLARK